MQVRSKLRTLIDVCSSVYDQRFKRTQLESLQNQIGAAAEARLATEMVIEFTLSVSLFCWY